MTKLRETAILVQAVQSEAVYCYNHVRSGRRRRENVGIARRGLHIKVNRC